MGISRITIAGAFASFAFVAPAACGATLYHYTDLGDLPGGLNDSSPWGINNYGQVAGRSSSTISTSRAFLWMPTTPNGTSGSMIDLGTLSGSSSVARAINDFGQLVGWTHAPSGVPAMVWTPTSPNATSGAMSVLVGVKDANAINALGQVAGWRDVAGGGEHALLWTPDTANTGGPGNIVDLGDLPGGEDVSRPSAINAYGQVVGSSLTPSPAVEGDSIATPFLWTPTAPNGQSGTMIALTNFPGGLAAGSAGGINASGQVVVTGVTTLVDDGPQAYRWTPDTPNGTTGSAISLGSLPYRTDTRASDINAAGDVVGLSGGSAFIWTEEDGMLDLNELVAGGLPEGVRLTQARAMNDVGQITGVAWIGNVTHAYLLTPIPEPAAGGAWAVTSALAIARRRRKR